MQPPMGREVFEIPLSKGKVALISACDFEWVSKYKWTATLTSRPGCKEKWYAIRRVTNIKTGKREGRYLHREIARKFITVPTGHVIDHLDGDGLNNQRGNLDVKLQIDNVVYSHFKKKVSNPDDITL